MRAERLPEGLMKRGFVGISCLVWVLSAMVGGPALGSDGVIEIDEDCVAAGCFSGDSGGFPVTIANPGSYILTSNLTVPNTSTDAIQLTSGRVRLDLNGFSILGTGTPPCSGCPASCTGSTGRGVYSTVALEEISIINGSIRGMGAAGINLIASMEIDRVSITHNAGGGAIITGGPALVSRSGFGRNASAGLSGPSGASIVVSDSVAACNAGDGIQLSGGSLVRSVTSINNNNDGINVGGGCTVTGSSARFNARGIVAVDSTVIGNAVQDNSGDGIYITGGSSVTNNTAEGNGGVGIFGGDGVTVTSNTVRSSTGLGLSLGTGSGYVGNVLTCNNNGGVCDNIAAQLSGGVSLGTNLCGTDTTCP